VGSTGGRCSVAVTHPDADRLEGIQESQSRDDLIPLPGQVHVQCGGRPCHAAPDLEAASHHGPEGAACLGPERLHVEVSEPGGLKGGVEHLDQIQLGHDSADHD